jgi:uncharacterized membrane protein YfcA
MIELILIVFGLGVCVAILTSMVGLGGGVLFIPILILIFNVDPQIAVGTSIFCMTMTTFSATIGYWRKGCVNWKLALAYDIFDLPGIILGAWLTTIMPGQILEIFCGIMVCLMGLMVLFKKAKKKDENSTPISKSNPKGSSSLSIDDNMSNLEVSKPSQNVTPIPSVSCETPRNYDFSFAFSGQNLKWVIISSFFGGLMTGMVGLGGGTVDTTTMVLLGVPMQTAAGSSSFAMLLTNLVGFSTHAFLGNVAWEYALPMGVGALIGAQIGSNYAPKVNANILRKILAGVAVFTGIRLLFP